MSHFNSEQLVFRSVGVGGNNELKCTEEEIKYLFFGD